MRDPVSDWAFSPDGKLLALRFVNKSGIWIVGRDGRGWRLTSGRGAAPAWSPDGKAVVFIQMLCTSCPVGSLDEDWAPYAVVVQPLHGKPRVLVRTGPNYERHPALYQPTWSPDGRWIAYMNLENATRQNGLTLVHPDGQRHRVVRGGSEDDWWAWSPDGRWIAFEGERSGLDYIAPSGLRHKLSTSAFGAVRWSPDGTHSPSWPPQASPSPGPTGRH